MKLILSLFLLSFSTFAATSGTLILSGIIPSIRSITVTPNSVASSLDLSTTQTDLKVATVNEKSNSLLGYKVTITSANLGNLKRSGGSEVVPYTLKYGGSNAPITSVSGHSVTNLSFPVNVNKDLEVSYTGVVPEATIEGTYSDTLTLTISAP